MLRNVGFRGHVVWQVVAASTLIYLMSLTFIEREGPRSALQVDRTLLSATIATYVGMKATELVARKVWAKRNGRQI
jgi:hypothetical protein